MTKIIISIKTNDAHEPCRVALKGRDAWALQILVEAGEAGCTPLNRPAPRWSEYVRRLRSKGLKIETIWEKHGGDYPGRHGRYVLRSQVQLLENVV